MRRVHFRIIPKAVDLVRLRRAVRGARDKAENAECAWKYAPPPPNDCELPARFFQCFRATSARSECAFAEVVNTQ